MKQIYDKKILALIKEFQKAGGVVYFNIFKFDEFGTLNRRQKHMRTALKTLENLVKEMNLQLNNAALEFKVPRETLAVFYIHKDRFLSPKLISVTEFMGSGYDTTNHKIVKNRESSGFCKAFLQPPYGLCMDDKEEFFIKFCKEMFDDINSL